MLSVLSDDRVKVINSSFRTAQGGYIKTENRIEIWFRSVTGILSWIQFFIAYTIHTTKLHFHLNCNCVCSDRCFFTYLSMLKINWRFLASSYGHIFELLSSVLQNFVFYNTVIFKEASHICFHIFLSILVPTEFRIGLPLVPPGLSFPCICRSLNTIVPTCDRSSTISSSSQRCLAK